MTEFIFVSDNAIVWDMRDDGTWVEIAEDNKASSIHELLTMYSGAVYELVADIARLPKPEPKIVGSIYTTDSATYIRFTEDTELPDPWICTRTGVRFSWHHIRSRS